MLYILGNKDVRLIKLKKRWKRFPSDGKDLIIQVE